MNPKVSSSQAVGVIVVCLLSRFAMGQASAGALAESASRVVKIYGAGGLGRVEGYGTGIVVSADGDILTAFGPILLADTPRVVLSDGRRFPAKVLRSDGQAGLALLDIDAEDLPYWDMGQSAARDDSGSVQVEAPAPGTSAFALTNAFGIAAGGEAVSIQRATLAAVTRIESDATRRAEPSAAVFILDGAIGNPGSAGGALVDRRGRLLGMIGREARDVRWNLWANQAIPAAQLRAFLERTEPPPRAEAPSAETPDHALDTRGIYLLPDVLDQTPPFVDAVEPGSPAARAELRPDDLVAFVEETPVRSVADFRRALARAPAGQPIRLSVLRGGALVELRLGAREK